MARLIDADAPMEHYKDMQGYERCACNFMDDGGEPATEWYCVEDALENAPTIDAIPVEYIKDEAGKYEYSGCIESAIVIEGLISSWQKEQGAR